MTASSDITKQELAALFSALKSKALLQRSEKIAARVNRLKKIAKWIEDHDIDIKTALFDDFQKPASEVDISEILPIIKEIKHTLNHLDSWSRPKKVDTPLTLIGSTSYIQYEPKGVCLIISPWNFPFNLAIGPLISCLAAGNTAVIKPSEMTPNTSALIASMVDELFSPNEVKVVNGGVEASQMLLKFPFDHIFFTGSPQVGKIVMHAAAENLTSVTLELGGKSPAIIDETTNIKDAAERISWGKFINNGQTCIAPDYLLVHESIQDKFLALLKTSVANQFNASNEGYENSSAYGRIVSKNHFERLIRLLKNATENGAEIEMGGNSIVEQNLIPPIILSKVSKDSAIMEEEIFGPLLPIISFSLLDEAIEIINQKPKPLALYYFGKNSKNRQRVLKETSAGGVCINDCVLHFTHTNLPFGGVNNSGIGKSHGHHGFLAFSNEKGVLKQRIGLTSLKFVYPPYTSFSKMLIKLLKKYF